MTIQVIGCDHRSRAQRNQRVFDFRSCRLRIDGYRCRGVRHCEIGDSHLWTRNDSQRNPIAAPDAAIVQVRAGFIDECYERCIGQWVTLGSKDRGGIRTLRGVGANYAANGIV
jgi:hypothetical protein